LSAFQGGHHHENDFDQRLSPSLSRLLIAGFGRAPARVSAGRRPGPARAGRNCLTGKTMNGFSQVGEANWKVEDGAIVATEGKGGTGHQGTPTRTT